MNDSIRFANTCYEYAFYYLTEVRRYCPSTVLANIREVRSIAEDVGWEHFDFTIDDVDRVEREARIKLAENYYRQALYFPSFKVQDYTSGVRSIAEDVGWKHFDFTVDDVDRLEREAGIELAA